MLLILASDYSYLLHPLVHVIMLKQTAMWK